MMIKQLTLFFCFFTFSCFSQLGIEEPNVNLGTIEEASEISGNILLSNTGGSKIYLLRADADPGMKVYTSKKTLLPGDTALLVISFVPDKKGKFDKDIFLVSSDRAKPYPLNLSGQINKLKLNDKTACYYFGRQRKQNSRINEEPLAVTPVETPRDNSNRMAGSDPPRVKKEPVMPVAPATATSQAKPAETEPTQDQTLPSTLYKPNNILILVDISSSMRDSLKLPLMKLALHTLIDAIREQDLITFVTYADSVKVIQEAKNSASREDLHVAVNKLKARGMTKGRKAILFSQQLVQKHYITEGNNQIIIASDGEFKFTPEDFQTWKNNQAEKSVVLSSVALGDDQAAIRNLKEIARKGGGSFIRIRKRNDSEKLLLEEVKTRSKR